ncbi:hypothetical protein Poli38472_010053 [Pythium oligandrum]|uniref:Myosin motor domain-containing protein n=1 Tax=Pythium oligandrum TaxID=41045 RepID=A0A8K1C890_PYTOL|nr:hypothetical protein Poli38472_010053 [Pythium oligandrum]|eukprot:TMW58494.1 hypothetical protein Poli38472_010053 [Pythium oligandrum]
MEGTRVYVPDERFVWLAATVTAVEDDGKKFHVRVELPAREALDGGVGIAREDQDLIEERVVDLRDDGMPAALPLQNSANDLIHKQKKRDDAVIEQVTKALGQSLMTATTTIGADDMCELHYLHEPAIVYNIRDRFLSRVPYTYTGKIVVAVNPYQWIKPLYTDALQELYTQHPREVLPPHVYATSAEAFHNMKHHRIPQSILVSGESGAGKTETVKIMMEHLASISMAHAAALRKNGTTPPVSSANGMPPPAPVQQHHSIVEKVLKSNPLLEAFGNAKTIRNDNSSRFGKFTQLQFNGEHCLIGAECRHYLLEKSRVVAQAPGERNYHIFYQLVSAHEEKYGFEESSSAKDFRYLQDEHVLLDGQSDIERYQVTCDALTTVGVTVEEQEHLFKALCGVLRLGELDFVQLDSADSSQPLASVDPASPGADAQVIEEQRRQIEACAKLLGVEVATLGKTMCSRTVRARQEVYSVPLSEVQAGNNRDALAKEIYARLFAYLVRRVNKSISGSVRNAPTYAHIDLLDIFGFESFKRNSFEQFCINFANEKLQQKFTLDVFKTVQEEYTREEVGWEFIKYKDNQDMLDLLENSMGLMALLNEECVRPMGSDVSFTSKIVSLHESHPRLEKARLSQTQFLLHHYAGAVTYDAEGFVEKNRDSLQSDLIELLMTSTNALVAGVFGGRASGLLGGDADLAAVFAAANSDDTRRSVGGRVGSDDRRSVTGRKTATFMQETVSYKFKAQLALLMSDISATEVHYVRCIKPNSKKSPNSYEIDAVVSQLRCAGVIEAIRITRAAFPNKMTHEKFLRRFVLLRSASDDSTESALTAAAACDKLVKKLLAKGDLKRDEEDATTPAFVVGKTLIYFGKDVLEYLEQRRTVFVHESAVKIQRSARRWVAKRRLMKVRMMITKLQAIQKRRTQRRVFVEQRTQCVKIQSLWRGVRSRQRTHFILKTVMATKLQSAFRAYQARQRFTRFRVAVVKIQASMKMKKQVGKYQQRLVQQKEEEHMESEVAQLKQRLEDEKKARLVIEAENSSLQQELRVVRESTASFAENDHMTSHLAAHSKSDRDTFNDDAKLLDDSERMIDYLKKEVTKNRDLVAALTQENENLKVEYKKVKDAYAAAGASFAALNQHNKQQSKANLRLMSTHAALIKSQEEKMKKYQKQIVDLKEDLKMQRSVYSAELMARVQQQDLLLEMVRMSESYNVPEELLEKMRSMIENSKPLYNGANKPPLARQGSSGPEGRSQRSDTATSIGPVSVSISQQGTGRTSSVGSYGHTRGERRATIDSVLMNPPLQRNLVDAMPSSSNGSNGYNDRESSYQERSTWVSSGSRASMYYDEDSKHRKSRLGGMIKKMFKKDAHQEY